MVAEQLPLCLNKKIIIGSESNNYEIKFRFFIKFIISSVFPFKKSEREEILKIKEDKIK